MKTFLLILSSVVLLTSWQDEKRPLLSPEELMGQFQPSEHPDFIQILPAHSDKKGLYLRKEVYEAYNRMDEAARQEKIKLRIISATRNFNHQRAIWDRKWVQTKDGAISDYDKARRIMQFSAMPGTSRHHWGTEVDLNALNDDYFSADEGLKTYRWLCQHAERFGFFRPYTSKTNGRVGYEEEKWHWSYLPLSGPFLEQYNAAIKAKNLRGFKGAELADTLNVLRDYVNGVDLPSR